VPRAEQSPFRIDGFEYNSKDGGKIYQNNGTYETSFGTFPFHPLTWEISDLAPIPLTPGILEKAGFHFGFHENGTYFIDLNEIDKQLEIMLSGNEFYPQIVQAPEMSNEDCQVVSLNKIEHLHQLQNLFWCLTGSELTVNL
jgi:hypothetical protein